MAVDGDPHFIIELPDRNDALCFNTDDKPGTIFNLVKDTVSGKCVLLDVLLIVITTHLIYTLAFTYNNIQILYMSLNKSTGLMINGQTIGDKKVEPGSKQHTYFGQFGIVHRKFSIRLLVTTQKIIVTEQSKQQQLQWSQTSSVKGSKYVEYSEIKRKY